MEVNIVVHGGVLDKQRVHLQQQAHDSFGGRIGLGATGGLSARAVFRVDAHDIHTGSQAATSTPTNIVTHDAASAVRRRC